MRRLLLIFAGLLLACQTLSPARLIASPTPFETAPVTATVTPTAAASPTPTSVTPEAVQENFSVRVHPEDGLYVGDLVSFEVLAPEGVNVRESQVEVRVNHPGGPILGPEPFGGFGIAGRSQATLLWAWDTQGQAPGEYQLTFRVLPDGPSWTQYVTLHPWDALPPYALNGEWASATNQCCTIYYVTNTASERDIAEILLEADAQADLAEERIGEQLDERLEVVLLPRVLGHGGFAADEIYISYLDRNYAGGGLGNVLHHEIVHILDHKLGGEARPTIFVEGLAVYLTGGHFKPEPLLPRAVALLELDWYIPLEPLTNNFYFEQHEIGYLEAGALVEYMVDRWGYPAFDAFYRDIQPSEDQEQASAIDAALQRHFGLGLSQLEEQFLTALGTIEPNPDWRADVLQTVAFYDAVRRYQQTFDPSAYFLTAWLLDIDEMTEVAVVADYLRHPSQADNLALETLLVAADYYLLAGMYPQADEHLVAVNAVLDQIDNNQPSPFSAQPLAANHYAIVQTLLELGYYPQQILVNETSAQVIATTIGPTIVELDLSFDSQVWFLD